MNSQCQGTTTKNGPCRITRGLDKHSYCTHHQHQRQHQHQHQDDTNNDDDQHPTEQAGRCVGTTKAGQQCKISWDLDHHSHCKRHQHQRQHQHQHQDDTNNDDDQRPTEQAGRCVGTTKAGQQCKISWDLDHHSYCKRHAYQFNTDGQLSCSVRPVLSQHTSSLCEDITSAESDDADTSDASPSDDEYKDADPSECKSSKASTTLRFGNVTWLGREQPSAAIRWTIHDHHGTVIERGTGAPGDECLVKNVDSHNLQLLSLTVAVDAMKKSSTPYKLTQLQPSATLKISTSRRVEVHVLTSGGGAE